MKNILKKENLMPVIVLGAICLIVAALIGVINMVTAPEIEKQLTAAANAAKVEVLPTADPLTFSENILSEVKSSGKEIPSEISAIYKADTGYVFEAKVSGNASGMIIMCGISNDGKITGVKDITNGETPSYWAKVTNLLGGSASRYTGTDTSSLVPDLVSGATKSSTGIYNAVKAASKSFAAIKGDSADVPEDDAPVEVVDTVTPKVERTDEEKMALAVAMYEGEVALESMFIYNPDPTLIGVYKNSADDTYVLHLATRTQYVALETEAMILVDNAGKVLKIDLLNWVVGHGINYTPEYLNSFIGKTKYFTDEVELVAEATVTSNNLVVALKNALFDVFGSVCATDSEIDQLAYKVIPAGESLTKVELPDDAPATVKRMYKIDSGRGYVFFVSTATDRAPYETEAFVYTDINGKLMNVYIAGWVVGHNIYPTDTYIDGLKGKTIEELKDEEGDAVEHVSAATGTSVHLEHAIADAMSIVPEHINYSVIAIVVLAVALLGSVCYSVIINVKRRKNR